MTRIRFEDLPSTNTPINAENLNKLNNVIVSSEEPTTGEEVWIKKNDNENNIYIKNENGSYEKFVIQEQGTNVSLTKANDNIQQHWARYRKNLLRIDVMLQGIFNTGSIIIDGMPIKPPFPQYCNTSFGIFKLNTDGKIELLNGSGQWGQVMLVFFDFK